MNRQLSMAVWTAAIGLALTAQAQAAGTAGLTSVTLNDTMETRFSTM